jgi:hypothetical protein
VRPADEDAPLVQLADEDEPRAEPRPDRPRRRADPDRPRPDRADRPRSSYLWLILVLLGGGVLASVAVCGGVAYFVTRSGPRPDADAASAPAETVRVDGGKAEVPFELGKAPREANGEYRRAFRFDSPGGKVYFVSVSDPHLSVILKAPDGAVTQSPPGARGGGADGGLILRARLPGEYEVTLSTKWAFTRGTLSIRDLDLSDPLPQEQRQRCDVAFPALGDLHARPRHPHERVCGAAFSPDGRSLFLSHHGQTLSYWTDPKEPRKATLRTPNEVLCGMAIDGRGRMYAQRVPQKLLGEPFERTPADLSVWDKIEPTDRARLPAPDRTLPLGGIVARAVPSPDGRHLYLFDSHRRRLCRIDSELGKIDRELADLTPGVNSFCVTADGKRIYCCSSANRLDVIDAERFAVEKTVALDEGNPLDVAATSDGVVFLLGKKEAPGEFTFGQSVFVLDLTRGLPDRVKALRVRLATSLAFWGEFRGIRMLPDRSAVLLYGGKALVLVSIPTDLKLDRVEVREAFKLGAFEESEITLRPDGRAAVVESGRILSIVR